MVPCPTTGALESECRNVRTYETSFLLSLKGRKDDRRVSSEESNRTAPEIVEKVLYLRRPIAWGRRIVWYLAFYHSDKCVL